MSVVTDAVAGIPGRSAMDYRTWARQHCGLFK